MDSKNFLFVSIGGLIGDIVWQYASHYDGDVAIQIAIRDMQGYAKARISMERVTAAEEQAMRAKAAAAAILLLWACGPAGSIEHKSAAAALQADSTCGMSHTVVHADPTALVKEFVARDGNGEFLGASTWLDDALECPNLWGSDVAALAVRTNVRPLDVAPDSARVIVTYHVAGIIGSSANLPDTLKGLTKRDSTETDTVLVDRTPFGWRIREPRMPHVTISGALRSFKFDSLNRSAIETAGQNP